MFELFGAWSFVENRCLSMGLLVPNGTSHFSLHSRDVCSVSQLLRYVRKSNTMSKFDNEGQDLRHSTENVQFNTCDLSEFEQHGDIRYAKDNRRTHSVKQGCFRLSTGMSSCDLDPF